MPETPIIEPEYEDDLPAGTDERAANVMLIVTAASKTLKAIKHARDRGDLDPSETAIERLGAAIRTGKRITDHPEYEAFREDVTALDDDLLSARGPRGGRDRRSGSRSPAAG